MCINSVIATILRKTIYILTSSISAFSKLYVIQLSFVSYFLFNFHTGIAQSNNETLNSYKKGLSLLTECLRVLENGGTPETIKSISFSSSGIYYPYKQGYSSSIRPDSLPIEFNLIYSLPDGKSKFTQKINMPDGRFYTKQSYGNDTCIRETTNNSNTYIQQPIGSPISADIIRSHPLIYLKSILTNPPSIRYLGDSYSVNAQKEALVTFFLANNQYTFHIDIASKMVTRCEVLLSDVILGDYLSEYHYSNYQTINGVLFPTYVLQYENGRISKRLSYANFTINQKIDNQIFKLPEGTMPFQSPTVTVNSIAKDVYVAEGIEGSYRSFIVELNDGILVTDAPVNSQVSSSLITQIKKIIPNKPIKYIVATHHHDDHIGGIRSFVAEGATIVTTRNNMAFFNNMILAEHTLKPDELSQQKQTAKFLFVEKKHSLSYSGGTIEIICLQKNLHAQDMCIVYVPSEELIFQSDLFNRKITPYTNEFIREITTLGLKVKTIISSHGGVVPMSQIMSEIVE